VKKLAIVVAVAIAVAGGAAYWAYHSLDLIVRVAIEHYGPEVVGVPVKVGSIDISPSNGRGLVKGLEVGNAAGFTAPQALRVGQILVSLDPATITEPVVRIREIALESPVVTYERADRGTNLEAIRDNIRRYIDASRAASGPRGQGASAAGGRRRFIVDRLVMRGASVVMTNPQLRGQGIRFGIPDIELADLGKREGGLTASEIGDIVAAELEARIAQKVLGSMDLLRKGGVGGALDALKGLLR
jgi:uncharacterized protein involved in outer membrane biogenesis